MKMPFKNFKNIGKIFLCLLLCALFFTCAACVKGDQNVTRKTTQDYVEKFLDAAADDDYEKMGKLLHPSSRVKLDEYLHLMENNYKIYLSGGVTLNGYDGYTAVNYDGSVDGSYGEISARIVTRTNVSATIVIRVVKNAEGEGIYSLDITKN